MTVLTQKLGPDSSHGPGRWAFTESERQAVNEACLQAIDAWKQAQLPWDWADLLVELNGVVIRTVRDEKRKALSGQPA